MELNKIIQGDCLNIMKDISDESVDLVVTDPPYGLTNLNPLDLIDDENIKSKGFMGKKWDNLPNVAIWKECLRVMKPGAFAFVMAIPRQDALMVMQYRLAKAGFNINFTSLYHCFASGFPKSANIAKIIDKKVDKVIEDMYIDYYKHLEKIICNLNNVNIAEKTFHTTKERVGKNMLKNSSVLVNVIGNTQEKIQKQLIKVDSSSVNIVEILFQKNQTEIGTCMPKSDFVLVNVHGNMQQNKLQLLNVIIAELNLNEVNHLLEKNTTIVQENVEVDTKQKSSNVDIVEKKSQDRKAYKQNTALNYVIIYQCEKIMKKIKEDEALKTELGNQLLSKETTIGVNYAELTDILKHIILSHSKTFQSLDTILQMELLIAITVIITKSTMECLITNMGDIWGINLKEKNIDSKSKLFKVVDKRFGVEREVVGKPTNLHKGIAFNVERGYNQNKLLSPDEVMLTAPATPEAKDLDGSYTFNPKPAVEIIIVAMKPLSEKSYVDQALKNEKGIVWFDDCKIPHNEKLLCHQGGSDNQNVYGEYKLKYEQTGREYSNEGRFPANLLVSSNVLNDEKEHKGSPVGFKNIGWKHSGNTKDEMTELKWQQEFNDSGSFSRYFSLDAWFAEHFKKLPKEVQKVFPFLIVPKSSRSEKNVGCKNIYTLKENVSDEDIKSIKSILK